MIAVIGGSGFIGQEICKVLMKKNLQHFSLSSDVMNLLCANSVGELSDKLNHSDVIIFCSALAPCKDVKMFRENVQMVENFISHVKKDKRLIYLSSDAVYDDTMSRITEDSDCRPTSIHGLMHITREYLLKSHFTDLAIVRPTLVYGFGDPHNGYGPNRFMRQAIKGEVLSIFGQGEELRDHIHVSYVAELIYLIVQKKCRGVFNAVSGHEITFKEIAQSVIKFTNSKSEIKSIQRTGGMPHNGIRIFDNAKVKSYFSEIHAPTFLEGLANYQ